MALECSDIFLGFLTRPACFLVVYCRYLALGRVFVHVRHDGLQYLVCTGVFLVCLNLGDGKIADLQQELPYPTSELHRMLIKGTRVGAKEENGHSMLNGVSVVFRYIFSNPPREVVAHVCDYGIGDRKQTRMLSIISADTGLTSSLSRRHFHVGLFSPSLNNFT
ncbi:hypothetical protein MSAN_01755600 [Mycena sanguinolenta]|uniref:Uncharacterized protein n=1 Tax=Mycena sanguinolenta TaxID=230812 RepID=A0A8H6XVQ3_9AGAR|nr:hypothetical protein MSAN_01755600 [Mycena sanguinolenta]